jgi:hypothetical protein
MYLAIITLSLLGSIVSIFLVEKSELVEHNLLHIQV